MEKKYNLIINNSKFNFSAKDKEKNILDLAIMSKINLPHGCKSGACGSCITKLVKGSVTKSNTSEKITANNNILLCQTFFNSNEIIIEYPKDKLELIKDQNEKTSSFKAKEYLLQVVSNKKVTPLVNELSLYVPEKLNFKFLPGSHMELHDGESGLIRKYSILNSPDKFFNLTNNILKFLIIKQKKSGLSHIIHDRITTGDLISIKGPFLSFQYKENIKKPIIGIAGGTGISPILSIIKHLLLKNSDLNVMIFLSVRCRNEILEFDTLYQLKAKYKNFNFKITLSRQSECSNNLFLLGKLESNLKKVFKDLSNHIIIISGSEGFVDYAKKNTLNTKAKDKNIFYEKFSKN